MIQQISRRQFLNAAAAGTLGMVRGPSLDDASGTETGGKPDFPVIDFHAHLAGDFPLEKALERAKERGVKFGIVEHAGSGRSISNNDEMKRYLAYLAGQPVYKGIQAEGLDWMNYFSKELVAQLDFVLSDALTFPEKDGRLMRLWKPEVKIEDKQDFMERYVDFNVRVIAEEPIDILGNPTFLPVGLQAEYDALWTKDRMQKVIYAAANYGVAIEINSRYHIPSVPFIRTAMGAGIKFSFGSNAHGDDAGKLDYCLKVAAELGLKRRDMFMPAPAKRKPILMRTFARPGNTAGV